MFENKKESLIIISSLLIIGFLTGLFFQDSILGKVSFNFRGVHNISGTLCSDTDPTNNQLIVGTTRSNEQVFEDTCMGSMITQYNCATNGSAIASTDWCQPIQTSGPDRNGNCFGNRANNCESGRCTHYQETTSIPCQAQSNQQASQTTNNTRSNNNQTNPRQTTNSRDLSRQINQEQVTQISQETKKAGLFNRIISSIFSRSRNTQEDNTPSYVVEDEQSQEDIEGTTYPVNERNTETSEEITEEESPDGFRDIRTQGKYCNRDLDCEGTGFAGKDDFEGQNFIERSTYVGDSKCINHLCELRLLNNSAIDCTTLNSVGRYSPYLGNDTCKYGYGIFYYCGDVYTQVTPDCNTNDFSCQSGSTMYNEPIIEHKCVEKENSPDLLYGKRCRYDSDCSIPSWTREGRHGVEVQQGIKFCSEGICKFRIAPNNGDRTICYSTEFGNIPCPDSESFTHLTPDYLCGKVYVDGLGISYGCVEAP